MGYLWLSQSEVPPTDFDSPNYGRRIGTDRATPGWPLLAAQQPQHSSNPRSSYRDTTRLAAAVGRDPLAGSSNRPSPATIVLSSLATRFTFARSGSGHSRSRWCTNRRLRRSWRWHSSRQKVGLHRWNSARCSANSRCSSCCRSSPRSGCGQRRRGCRRRNRRLRRNSRWHSSRHQGSWPECCWYSANSRCSSCSRSRSRSGFGTRCCRRSSRRSRRSWR